MKAKPKKKPSTKASASKAAPSRAPAKGAVDKKAVAKKAAPAAKSLPKAPVKAAKAKPVAGKAVEVKAAASKVTPVSKKAPKAANEKAKKTAPRVFEDPEDDMVLDAAELEAEALGGEIDGEEIEIEVEEEEVDLETDSDDDDDDAVVVAEASDEDVVLTDAEGNRYCRARDCDQIAIVDAYCRYHYLLFWKKIQVRKKILADGKLERYVDELTARYPDKFLEMIRRDLRTEKDFVAAIQELEIDESGLDNEYEEDTQSFIDEVRGMGGESESVEDDY